MPANTNVIPLKAIYSGGYTGGDVVALGELNAGDKLDPTFIDLSDYIQVANVTTSLADYWPSANVISYVSSEVSSLIDSAPDALNTLNELAAALGDDANFASTVTTNLGQKLGATATVTLTGDVTASATAFSANAVSLSTSLATSSGSTLANYITVANTAATYQTIAVERAALANTNAYIATKEDVGTATAMAIALG